MVIKKYIAGVLTCYQDVVLYIKNVWKERLESSDVVLIERVPRNESNCQKARLEDKRELTPLADLETKSVCVSWIYVLIWTFKYIQPQLYFSHTLLVIPTESL